MSTLESLESINNFFEDINKKERVVTSFNESYQLSMYEFQLLSIIYTHEKILLRQIIKENMIKKNQVNKSVKKLYDLKLINKLRLPMDERTVELSIKSGNVKEVEEMIRCFGSAINKEYQ